MVYKVKRRKPRLAGAGTLSVAGLNCTAQLRLQHLSELIVHMSGMLTLYEFEKPGFCWGQLLHVVGM